MKPEESAGVAFYGVVRQSDNCNMENDKSDNQGSVQVFQVGSDKVGLFGELRSAKKSAA